MISPSTPTTEAILKFLPVTIPPSKRFLPKQTQSIAACSLINLWLEKLFGQDLLRVMGGRLPIPAFLKIDEQNLCQNFL